MLRRHITFAVVAIAAALLVACFPDYFPRREAKDINEQQVIGSWQLTPASAEKFLVYPVPPETKSTAEFTSNGHCSLNNLAYNGDLFSGEGTWKLTTDDDRGGPRFSVLEIQLPNSSGGHAHVFTFYFTRVHQRLIFWQYVGDPDSRDYVEYERI